MNELDEVIGQVRESFSGLRMDVPVESILAKGRTRRHRQVAGLTTAAAAAAGAAAVLTLSLGGSAPAQPGHPAASSGRVTLAAFSVTSGPGNNTTVIVHKGPQYQLSPSALREELAQHGIPALVTVGSFCRSTTGDLGSVGQILHPSTAADGSDVMVIDGSAIPPRTRLSIGEVGNATRMAIIKDGAPLTCSSTSGQPAVHLTPSGTAIRDLPVASRS